jgi:hypothetical protein
MGILSDFFLASGDAVPDYAGGAQFDASDKCQFKGLTPLQAGQFLAVLRGQKYTVEMVREFQLVTPEEAEQWTMCVPQDMVAAMAGIHDENITEIAGTFADITAKELRWTPQDFVPVVTELSALARRAIETGKSMYLWNSL